MREAEVMSLMRRYDRDGDGLLSIREFEQMIRSADSDCQFKTPKKRRKQLVRTSDLRR